MRGYRVASGVLRAELEGEEVLLNPATGQYHLINATGREILEAWERGLSSDEAVGAIAERFHKPFEEVDDDARRFATALIERGLLEESE